MFILRKISSEKGEVNECLGVSYSLVEKCLFPEEFEKARKNWCGGPVDENIYAFLIHDNGAQLTPLYKGQSNYIMTESGKTFANLSTR